MDSGGSDVQIARAESAPWAPQGAKLEHGYNQAAQLLGSGIGSHSFPGATYVPMSNQTGQGLGQIESLAGQGGQLTPMASGEAAKVLGGHYLNAGNPEFQGMVNRIGQSIRPNIDATFAAAGRGGSGAHANAYSSALADAAGNLAYQNYGDERNRMTSALGMAPGLDAARFADAERLMQAGGVREGYAGMELQDALRRFNEQENLPWQNLARYQAIISGGSPGSTTTQMIPTQSNPWATGVGTAAGLASIAGSLFGRGGVWGSA